jgi:hypothetical protein
MKFPRETEAVGWVISYDYLSIIKKIADRHNDAYSQCSLEDIEVILLSVEEYKRRIYSTW